MNMKRKKLTIFLCVFAVSALHVLSESLVTYNLNSSSFAATTSHDDISVSGVGITGDWQISGASGNLYIEGATNVPTGTADLNEYVKFTINPQEEQISYESINFDFGGDNNASATPYTVTVELRSSIDNFVSVLGSDSYTIPIKATGSFTSAVLDLRGVASLQSIKSTVEFRLYMYDNTDAGSTSTFRARIDNISASGSVGVATSIRLMVISSTN